MADHSMCSRGWRLGGVGTSQVLLRPGLCLCSTASPQLFVNFHASPVILGVELI